MSTGNDGWLPPGSGSAPQNQPQWTAPGSAPTGAPQAAPPPQGAPAVGAAQAGLSPGVPAAWQQPAQAVDAAPTVQPGVVPPRPLKLGDIYSAATSVLRVNPAATFGLTGLTALLVVLPLTLLTTGLTRLANTAYNPGDVFSADVPTSAAEDFVTQMAGLTSTYIGTLITQFAATTFIAFVVGQAVFGAKVGMDATWKGSRSRIWTVAVAGLISLAASLLVFALGAGLVALLWQSAGVATALVTAAFLVFAGLLLFLFLWTRFSFVVQAIVLDRTGPLAAYGRSWALTRGPVFWRIFGIRLLTGLIVSTVASIVTAPISLVLGVFSAAGGLGSTLYVLGTGLATILSTWISTPPVTTVDSLLYVDSRIRLEGFNINLIEYATGTQAAPWPIVTSNG